jgi:hypothetical protein
MLPVKGPVTIEAVIHAIEAHYPMLAGTIREHGSGKRRAYVRFFACGRDLSQEPFTLPLPDDVQSGKEPLMILGAISGG